MIKRFHEIDVLRGGAVLGMIVFHVMYGLDFVGRLDVNFGSGFYYWLGWVVRITFILLVGVSMALCYRNYKGREKEFRRKQVRRGLMILLCGILFVTLPTLVLIPEGYVRFGVLHFIGVAILLLFMFVDNYLLMIFLSVFALPVGRLMKRVVFDSDVFMIFGFNVRKFWTIDLFPIFPWVGLVAFGVLLGHLLYLKGRPVLRSGGFLAWVGKRALVIYVVHLVILFGALSVLS